MYHDAGLCRQGRGLASSVWFVPASTPSNQNRRTLQLPLIDLNDHIDRQARLIDEACRETGFFAIVGHDVPRSVVNAAWLTTEAFFDLPLSAKMDARSSDPEYPYGYFPGGVEALARSRGVGTPPDLKESFNLAPPVHHLDEAGRFGGVERIWPTRPDGFEEAWSAYYGAMLQLSNRLMAVFARALGEADSFFESSLDQHLCALRGLNYPPLIDTVRPGQLRAGEHTDYGTLTILLPGPGTGGLEVQRTDGRWQAVGPTGDQSAFVVNIGDMMQRWTNDRWRSTLHRVVIPDMGSRATERRQSLAFFHQPNWYARVEVLASCVDDGNPAKYEPVLAGPWIQKKFDSASATTEGRRTEFGRSSS